jgi:hypothetical protein
MSTSTTQKITGDILVDLALQGGGAHGAFTWGVLDRLVEEKRLRIDFRHICGGHERGGARRRLYGRRSRGRTQGARILLERRLAIGALQPVPARPARCAAGPLVARPLAPVALIFYTNRILNPAVVVIEVLLNLYVLFINLNGVPAVWKRVVPILIGLLPGIAVGAFVLASLQPGWIKFGTYTALLPLILVQAAGWRRPIRSTWLIGLPFGTALGILYSVTTISGTPLSDFVQ